MGVWVWGQDRQIFHIYQKMRKKISHLLILISSLGRWGNCAFNEKPTKKLQLRGFEFRGLRQNQISIPYYKYQNDQHEKIYAFGDSGRETPTHMAGTHAISKFWEN